MTVYTIKGLYIKGENPTYFGTLEETMHYVDNSMYLFIHYGEDIEICKGNAVVARQKWIEKFDDLGEYYEPEEWEVLWERWMIDYVEWQG